MDGSPDIATQILLVAFIRLALNQFLVRVLLWELLCPVTIIQAANITIGFRFHKSEPSEHGRPAANS